MAVGDDRIIQRSQIEPGSLKVLFEYRFVVPRIEQDFLAFIFDQRGKTPVLVESRIISESVVEDGDAVAACTGFNGPGRGNEAAEQHEGQDDQAFGLLE